MSQVAHVSEEAQRTIGNAQRVHQEPHIAKEKASRWPARLYYGIPTVNLLMSMGIILFGAGWFISIVDALSKVIVLATGQAATTDVSARAFFVYATICLVCGALRIRSALNIPVHAPTGRTKDRMLSFLPAGLMILVTAIIWSRSWPTFPFEGLQLRMIMFAVLVSAILDVWIATFALNKTVAEKSSLDVR